MSDNAVIVLSQELTSSDGEIKLFPIGLVHSQKGSFTVDEEGVKEMIENFKAHGVDIVVDYEHQTLENTQAPAGGWIKDFYIKDGAVVAKIEWTPKAKEYIKNREYRYLSPVVIVRKEDNKAVRLHSVGLTNTPAIDNMFPIINAEKITFERVVNLELLEQLRKLLGLDEGTSQEAMLEKLQEVAEKAAKSEEKQNAASGDGAETIVSNKVLYSILGLKEAATEQDIINAVMALKNPANYVTIGEFGKLKQRLEEKDAEDLVITALKEGKLTAAQKNWAKEYALKSPEGFKAYLKNASTVVPLGEINTVEAKKAIQDEHELKICKMLGLSAEDIAKYGKEGC